MERAESRESEQPADDKEDWLDDGVLPPQPQQEHAQHQGPADEKGALTASSQAPADDSKGAAAEQPAAAGQQACESEPAASQNSQPLQKDTLVRI